MCRKDSRELDPLQSQILKTRLDFFSPDKYKAITVFSFSKAAAKGARDIVGM